MDGDPVGEPSPADSSGGGDSAAAVSFTELFVSVFPDYMAMGMTYDEFWHGPAWLVEAYRKAYETRERHNEWARWRQGAYFFNALMCAAPVMRAALSKTRVEPGKYPDEPWPLTQKEADDREEKQRVARMKRFMAQLTKESETTAKEVKDNAEY